MNIVIFSMLQLTESATRQVKTRPTRRKHQGARQNMKMTWCNYLLNYWRDLSKGRHVYNLSNFVYLIKV